MFKMLVCLFKHDYLARCDKVKKKNKEMTDCGYYFLTSYHFMC